MKVILEYFKLAFSIFNLKVQVLLACQVVCASALEGGLKLQALSKLAKKSLYGVWRKTALLEGSKAHLCRHVISSKVAEIHFKFVLVQASSSSFQAGKIKSWYSLNGPIFKTLHCIKFSLKQVNWWLKSRRNLCLKFREILFYVKGFQRIIFNFVIT